jgi:hypothetical protein
VSSAYRMSTDVSETAIDELVGDNDSILEALIRGGRESAEGEIARLIVTVAQPVIRAVLAGYLRTDSALTADDADDIAAAMNLRLVAKLRALRLSPDDAIANLEKYVAGSTYNVINDHLRRAFPARAQLKNRLRYVATHDERLTLATIGSTPACGLREWPAHPGLLGTFEPSGIRITRAMLDRTDPARALAALLAQTARLVALDAAVSFFAALWNIVDSPMSQPEAAPASVAGPAEELEVRDSIRHLWREIRELRPMQRQALLLNLRGGDGVNAVALLVLTRTASFEEVAGALELTRSELTQLWNELPLDDLQIAARLGVTRQQVINLRKSARERLARRTKS